MFITLQAHRIEYQVIRGALPERPPIVFLHEGLGSIATWKDFPQRIVEATGHSALVYSRYGYGQSDPLDAPRSVDYLHEEALVALPELLDKLNVSAPILLGHSDGGSIALIHAGTSRRAVTGAIVMAPHVMVEDISIAGIKVARRAYETEELRTGLARYHADPDSAFRGWSDIWLSPEFRDWNIEDCLAGIRCPVLAIQGVDDSYGTLAQIERIADAVPHAQLLKLARCGHSPQRDRPEAIIKAVAEFVRRTR